MEDDRTSSESVINFPSRNDILMQNSLLDQVLKNTRDLEGFINYNAKFRNALIEMIQSYLARNDERLKYFYNMLKESLKNIENNTNNFNKHLQVVQSSHHTAIASKDDFNLVFAEKNNEVFESLLKMEFNHKYNFTISVFKPLLDLGKDEILRDILKEDYLMQIRSANTKILSYFKPPQVMNEKINEIPASLIEDINKKFNPNIHVTMNDYELYKSFNIQILNSFNVMIKISNEHQYIFKLTVALPDEYANIQPPNERKERKYINICKKLRIEDKSKYQTIRKISSLFEDRFNVILRYGKSPFKMGFYLFINWISNFNDIFKKKCFFCKQTAKLNLQEKCFYPPFYKFMDMETDNFFHEECYYFLNGSSI